MEYLNANTIFQTLKGLQAPATCSVIAALVAHRTGKEFEIVEEVVKKVLASGLVFGFVHQHNDHFWFVNPEDEDSEEEKDSEAESSEAESSVDEDSEDKDSEEEATATIR